jgi:hypothetical protein
MEVIDPLKARPMGERAQATMTASGIPDLLVLMRVAINVNSRDDAAGDSVSG